MYQFVMLFIMHALFVGLVLTLLVFSSVFMAGFFNWLIIPLGLPQMTFQEAVLDVLGISLALTLIRTWCDKREKGQVSCD